MKDSFRRRVAAAAAMLVGFYVLAGLVAAGLFGLAIAMFTTDIPQNIWIALACVVSGTAIVRGLIPRRARFEEPGPRLDPSDQPELHALVREVAETTGQQSPDDVYLAADVNAGVTDTGGLFGSGRRVLIVGLPLMDALTVGQLRAVLAHEFGHYYGGDTRLGPWFFRTRDAIERTLGHLAEAGSLWQIPFVRYGNFFLRRSAMISRQQEFEADELAARAAGKEAAISSLQILHRVGPAFDGYWQSEVAPLLDAGTRAPLLPGFRSFQAADSVRTAMEEHARAELEEGETDPYADHPSLRDRLEALERLPDDGRGESAGDERPAIELLRDPERAEHDLLVALFGEKLAGFELLGWDDVPERVIVPGWREYMTTYREALGGITAGGIADVAAGGLGAADALETFGRGLPLPPHVPPNGGSLPSELFERHAASALDVGLALALCDAGWTVSAPPGAPIVLRRGEQSIKPIGTVEALAKGELSRDEWASICERAGIAALPLGGKAAPAAAPTRPSVPAAS